MNQDPNRATGQNGKRHPVFDQDAVPHSRPNRETGQNRSPQAQRQVYKAGSAPSPKQTPRPAGMNAPPRRPQPETQHNQKAAPTKPVAQAVRRKPKKRRKRKVIIVLLTVLLVMGIGVWSLYATVQSRISNEGTQAGTLSQNVKTLPEYTGKGIVNILVCGIAYDNETADGFTSEEKVGRTDLLLYVHYDTASGKVNLLQIPRDVYVGEDADTGGDGKINGLYSHAPDPNNRMAALANVINDQLGLPIDYYVSIDMDSVKELIDVKGYIEVYIPMEISDPRNDSYLSAGWNNLNSEQAELLVRNRYNPGYQGQGDIMRLQMQQSFYSALYREFRSLSAWDLVGWVDVLTKHCTTDMDLKQLSGLALKAMQVKSEDITFIRPAASGGSYYGAAVLSLVPDETAELLNRYFRPEGDEKTVEELNIQTLPIDPKVGTYETSIRNMSEVQMAETESGT